VEWIYGRNVALSALAAGARRQAHRLAATAPALKALRGSLPPGFPVETVSAHELDELTGSRDHQGVAVQVDPFRYAPEEEVLAADLVVVLDEVTDPRNLGAVARSALAAGAGGLAVPRHRAAAVTPAAVKASAGATEHLDISHVVNVAAFLGALKQEGFWVYGAAGEAEQPYTSLDYTGKVALVFGSEGKGLRPLVKKSCDLCVSIPVRDPLDSLNVSVAAALLLYEARRQRGGAGA